MNFSLLQLLGKYVVLAMSVFNMGNYTETSTTIENNDINKDGSVMNYVTEYKTDVEYNSKLPSNITNVIKEGQVGLTIKSGEEPTVIQQVSNEVVEKGSGAYGIYTGKLVGYGPDCAGCSGEGYLACRAADGSKFSLKYNGIYYEDTTYGKVRILASNLTKFPCGTIIEVQKQDGTKFLAVVMDRIGTQIPNGEIMDLAYSSEVDKTVFAVDGLVGNNITYYVKRWGW